MKSMLLAAALLAVPTAAPTAKAPRATPKLLEKGAANFKLYCETCHGPEGHGDGPAGQVLNPRPRNFSSDPFKQGDKLENIFATLGTGVPGTPMVAWTMLPEEDRWSLAYHVRGLRTKGAKGKKK